MATITGNMNGVRRNTTPIIPGEKPTEKSFGGFLRTLTATKSKRKEVRLQAIESLEKDFGSVYKTPMNEASGSEGGYLVPYDFSLQLMNTLDQASIIYPRANKVPMWSATTYCPTVNTTTAQSAGTPPFFGGMLFTWGFQEVPPNTAATFSQVELTAWDLIGVTPISNQMLADLGPDGEKALVNVFGKAAAWFTEYAFFTGMGAGTQMPLGITNSKGKFVARASGNVVSNTDIGTMSAALLPFSWGNAIWACHPTVLAQVAKITNFQLNVDITRHPGAVGTLMTMPLYVTDKLPTLGSQGDIVLFDPSLYVVGVRSEVMIDVSDEQLFQTNQTMFRVWLRIDGRPQVSNLITLSDGSTTVSPYVILQA